MKTKDGKELPIEEITAENYLVPKGEERLFHVKQEIRQFNPKTGKKISHPEIQKFGAKIWKTIVSKQLKRFGYELEILHNPDEWLKKNAELVARAKAEKMKAAEEAKAKAESAKLAAIKEQAKAELLAELKAAGIIPDKKPGRPAKEKE